MNQRLLPFLTLVGVFFFPFVSLADENLRAVVEELRAVTEEQGRRIEQLEGLVQTLLEREEARCNSVKDTIQEKEVEDNGVATKTLSPQEEPIQDFGYDDGFYVSQQIEEDRWFKLKINGRMQFRYSGFTRDSPAYRMDDGTTGAQENKNDLEIERGRLAFSGSVADPNLKFFLNLDFDTDDNHEVIAHDYWFQYDFHRFFNLYAGKAFVPGSREWLDGSTTTQFADRSLATSFFRPDRSLGIWAIGEPADGLYYRLMVGNGFNTTDLTRDEIDSQFTYSGSVWMDLFDNYGLGRADLDRKDRLALRFGSSFTYSPVSSTLDERPLEEADAVRLSNGQRVNGLNVLVEGDFIDDYDIYLYAIDAALKYQGLSLHSEFYYRDLRDLSTSGGIEVSSISDKGGYLDLGYTVVPMLLEVVGRFAYINGSLSDASEFAGGINYFIDGGHLNKLTLDVSFLDNSPINSSGPNYVVGADGTLYRVQWQVGF